MQIVINISEKTYESVMDGTYCGTLYQELKNGTILPKGHGRLVDADEIDNNIYDLTRSMDLNYGQISEVVDTAPTIIEADGVESEEKHTKEDRLDKAISDIAYILDNLSLLRQIYKTGDCNICKNRDCGYMPKPGQMVRYNCPFYKAKSEAES